MRAISVAILYSGHARREGKGRRGQVGVGILMCGGVVGGLEGVLGGVCCVGWSIMFCFRRLRFAAVHKVDGSDPPTIIV